MSVAPSIPQRREWTVDDLAELPPDLNYELINGRLTLPSPTLGHQDVMFRVWQALDLHCPPEFVVGGDQSLEIDRRNEPRPDVVIVRSIHYNRTPVPVEDAILTVEIVSQHSQFRDMVEKSQVYAKAGIPRYWIIDQLQDLVRLSEKILDPGTRTYRDGITTTDRFEVDDPWPIVIDLPVITARRNAILEQAKPSDA